MKIIDWIKAVIQRMIGSNTIKSNLGVESSITQDMADKISMWGRMYQNNADWLDKNTKSLNLPAAIASELARLTTLEMKSEVTGSSRADYLNESYRNVLDDIMIQCEYACAKGGLMFKPYVDNGNIAVDYIQADSFVPTASDSNGKITGAVFVSQITRGDKYYTRLEYHNLSGTMYHIINKAFMSDSERDIGREISLESVEEWKDITPECTIANVKQPLFGYFKMPFANTIDPSSPVGVSAYSRATELIKEADKQYSRLLWEFEGSELAVHGDTTLFRKDEKGNNIYPKRKERLFVDLELSDEPYNVFSPAIRDTSLINGLNAILRRVEFNCNLAYGTLSDVQDVDKTAEEIKSSKQRSYTVICQIQKALQTALEDLLYAMDTLATLYKLAPAGMYEVNFDFDDSIVNDKVDERAQDRLDIQMGVMSLVEYRSKYYGEDIKTAKKNLPSMNELTGGDENAET